MTIKLSWPEPQDLPKEDLMIQVEASRVLGCHRERIRQLILKKKLRYAVVDGHKFVSKADVMKRKTWLRSRVKTLQNT